MTHKAENPAACSDADRAVASKGLCALDSCDITSNEQTVQAAIIAVKYRLSPSMARLVCHLANIGGSFA